MEKVEDVQMLYKNDNDFQKLKIRLVMLQDAVKATVMDNIPIKNVTRVQTLCDVFNEQPSYKILLSEIHKLLKLYLTIPVTTATAERSFSSLKRIKTYLRNSMTQERLNHCILLHTHRHKTDSLNLVNIAKEFTTRNERCKNFFGVFKYFFLQIIFSCIHVYTVQYGM